MDATKKTRLMEEHVPKQQRNDRDGQRARGIVTTPPQAVAAAMATVRTDTDGVRMDWVVGSDVAVAVAVGSSYLSTWSQKMVILSWKAI